MPRTLIPEDILGFAVIEDPQIAPSGEQVAYVIADSFKEQSPLPHAKIWIVDGNGTRQLTFGPRTDSHPRWSPDGAQLAFLSDRLEAGKRQPYLLDIQGGEARNLVEVDGDEVPAGVQDRGAW